MYMPELFAVTDPERVDAVLAGLRLGCLVSRDADGFFGTHLPVVFDPARRVLAGHIARANPHPSRSGDNEALMIFQGCDAYVSPSWYPSKTAHGRVVPTWNYEAVHVSGRLSWRTGEGWLRPHLALLTARFEREHPVPWALSDAPDDYLRRQFAGIVGMELEIREVLVKRKLSQNRSDEDRLGALAGLRASERAGDRETARAMEAEGD